MNFSLTAEDVHELLRDPSSEKRRQVAQKLGEVYSADLNARERRLAEDIFQVMLRDAEVRVRAALAQSLKNNPDIPHDIALRMARDVAEVAVPILESCDVLSTEDLVQIVRSRAPMQRLAVARRHSVDEALADALVDTADEDVVAALIANAGAQIRDDTLTRVVDNFGHLEKVQKPLVQRREMPVKLVERLMTMVSESLRNELVETHHLSPDMASGLAMQSRERATLDLLDRDDINAGDLIAQLYDNGRLTPTIIMRALCMGDTVFFEAALAKLAGIPMANVYTLVHDKGDLGLSALLKKCNIPPSMFDICRAAVRVAEETRYDGGPNDRKRFRDRMIERVLTMSEGSVDIENVDYFLAKMASSKIPYRPRQ